MERDAFCNVLQVKHQQFEEQLHLAEQDRAPFHMEDGKLQRRIEHFQKDLANTNFVWNVTPSAKQNSRTPDTFTNKMVEMIKKKNQLNVESLIKVNRVAFAPTLSAITESKVEKYEIKKHKRVGSRKKLDEQGDKKSKPKTGIIVSKAKEKQLGKVSNVKIGMSETKAETKTKAKQQIEIAQYFENMKHLLSKCSSGAYVVRCTYTDCPFQLIYFDTKPIKVEQPTGKSRWQPVQVRCKACGVYGRTQSLRCIVCNTNFKERRNEVCQCTGNEITQAVKSKLRERCRRSKIVTAQVCVPTEKATSKKQKKSCFC